MELGRAKQKPPLPNVRRGRGFQRADDPRRKDSMKEKHIPNPDGRPKVLKDAILTNVNLEKQQLHRMHNLVGLKGRSAFIREAIEEKLEREAEK